MAAYADCHVGVISLAPDLVATGNVTESVPDDRSTSVFANPEAETTQGHLDNIYDDAHDGPGMFSYQKGSPTRAWVK